MAGVFQFYIEFSACGFHRALFSSNQSVKSSLCDLFCRKVVGILRCISEVLSSAQRMNQARIKGITRAYRISYGSVVFGPNMLNIS